jgi:hypothetical protein
MLKKFTIFLIVFACLWLTACTHVVPLTESALPPSPPFTGTPSPTLTLTPTPHFQQTRIAAQQVIAAEALTQMANSWATATARIYNATASAPTPDWVPTQQALIAAIMTSNIPKIIETHLSTDGQLRAVVVRYDCVQVSGVDENAYEQLKIVRVNDGTEMVIADQLQSCGGIGASGLGGLFFSPSGRYFYFTTAKGGVPDGCCCDLWVRNMYRADVNTGYIENTPGTGELMVDGKTIVIPGKGEFILWDLDEGEIERVPYKNPDAYLICFRLSPDKDSLVYLQADNCLGSPGKSYLVYWDFATFQQALLLDVENPPLVNVIWESPDQLTLWDADSNEWQFDLVTKELIP